MVEGERDVIEGRRHRTGARRVLWALVSCVLLAEVVLQVVAWRLWATEWVGPVEVPRPGRVLVIGADEVFDPGVLVRDDAWPGEVARALRADGLVVDVVNGAWLARDSRDVMLRAPLQLTLERPEFVVVCVGSQDFRRRAATVVSEVELRGRNAPFRWTPRLPALVAGWFERAPQDRREALGFVGLWYFGDTAFSFELDGTFWMGSIATRWSVADGGLRIAVPGAEAFDVDWVLEGDRLDLRGGFPGGRLTLERGPVLSGPAERARASLSRGDVVEAELALLPAVRGASADPDAVVELVELEARLGRRDAARGFAERLADPPRDAAGRSRLARVRIALGDIDAGVDLVVGQLAGYAADVELFARLGALPRGPAAERVADRAVGVLATAPAAARPALAWLAAELLERSGRSEDALRLGVVGLVAVDGTPDPREVPAVVRGASDALWGTAVLAVAPLHPDRLAQQRAELVEADRATASILAANLRRLVALVRFYGAEPILLDPADDAVASSVRRAVARELDVPITSCAADRAALAAAFEGAVRAALGR